MSKWILSALILAGIASMSVGCKVEGEVGDVKSTPVKMS